MRWPVAHLPSQGGIGMAYSLGTWLQIIYDVCLLDDHEWRHGMSLGERFAYRALCNGAMVGRREGTAELRIKPSNSLYWLLRYRVCFAHLL